MGASKTDFFSKTDNDLAMVFKALGHPARVAIVQHLLEVNSCVCGDIVDVLPLSQPTISQHLKELKSVQLIKGSIEGNSICYCLNTEKWKEMENYFHDFFEQMTIKKACC
jgi:ArsR family transcriptional regulator